MKTRRAALYVRVSTSEQNTDAQETDLRQYAERRGWIVHDLYADRGISGGRIRRPGLDRLLADCRRRRVDVVLVWKFDRFARSLRQLVSALEEFKRLDIDFVSCTEAIDTSIPSGELVFQIFGAIAQFERALIRERVQSGLAQARRKGKVLGRPPIKRLTAEELEGVRQDRASGKFSLRRLARKYGTSLWAVYQATRRSHAGI